MRPFGLTIPNLLGWYDFSRQDGEVGEEIPVLRDLFGVRHVAQPVGTKRPVISELNGRKAAQFTFTDAEVLIGSGFPDADLPITVFAVVGWDGTGGSPGRYLSMGTPGGVLGPRCGGSNNTCGTTLGSNLVPAGEKHQLTSVFNGASSLIRRDGDQLFFGDAGSNDPGTSIAIGGNIDGSGPWSGPIGEVILVAGIPTDDLTRTIEDALGYKWQLGFGAPVPLDSETSNGLVAGHEPWITSDLEDYLRVVGTMFAETELYGFDTEDFEGWTILLDVDRCPVEALPYLAQYVGERLPAGLTEDEMRQWIRDAPNQQRGTLKSLVDATQRYLTGGKTVTVIERDLGHPDHVTVVTYTSETPDSAQVLAEINTVFPAELTLAYVVSGGQIWSQVIATDPDWANSMAESATWADLMAETPSGTYG